MIYLNANPWFCSDATTKLKQTATSITPTGGSDRNAFSLAALFLFTGTFMKRKYDACLIKKKQRAALSTTHQKKQLEKWKEKQGVKTKKETKKQKKCCAAKIILDSVQKPRHSTWSWATFSQQWIEKAGKKSYPSFFLLFLPSALAYHRNLPTKTQTTRETWVLKLFQAEFPLRELLNQSGWETKKKKKKKAQKYARQQPAGRDQQVREHQQKKKKRECTMLTDKRGSKATRGRRVNGSGRGEGSWRSATQRINWKRKSWIVKRDQRREVWSRKTHTQLRPAPSIC